MGKGNSPAASAMSLAGANGLSFAVTPGLLDEAAKEAYLRGQCAALAVALSEQLEGRIIAIGYDDSQEDRQQWEQKPIWGHLGLLLPDGSVLDVEGSSPDLDTWMERHRFWEAQEVSAQQAMTLEAFPSQDLETARSMAAAIISAL